MYNPIIQSQQKDARGLFIRQWLPELSSVPDSWIHTPWLMPLSMQQQHGCLIGLDYAAPVVELQQAQQSARAKIRQWLTQQDHLRWQQQQQAVFIHHASRKRPVANKTNNVKKSA